MTGTNAGPAPSSDDVMVHYKGKMMPRSEANKLRAADPNGPKITPVGTPATVPIRTTSGTLEPPTPPEGGDDPTPEDEHPVEIPKQLHGCRFILLKPKSKVPLEHWKEQNYKHDDPRLLQHIGDGGNYGVMVTGGLCVLDADNVPALLADPFFSDTLMQSFLVRTGRAPVPGAHIYFRCPGLPAEKRILETPDITDMGDIRGSDSIAYVVGPGSIHPTGNTYEIINDADPAPVPLEEVQAFIDRYDIKKKATPSHRAAEARTDAPQRHTSANISDSLGLKVTDFLMPENPQYQGDEIIGNHPIHGGDTGTNLHVNTRENAWRCFHHNTGGGPLEALAVTAGIIDCSEAGPGCLEGHWPAVFDALDGRGYGPQREKMNRERKQQTTGPRDPPRHPVPAPACATAAPEPDPEPGPPIETPDPEIMAEAERELTEEDPLSYFLEVFHTAHVGDDILAKCCYVSAASRMVKNSRGLHVLAIGPSGKGKSSTYDTVLEQMPDRFKIDGGLSDKALFYHPVPERAIFVLDDKEMSDALQEVFRGATSNIQKPYDHRTMINKKPVVLTLPAGCVWWMAASEDDADDQFHNRCLHPWVDDSKEADRAYCEHLLRSAAEGAREDPRFTVCRCMWDLISSDVLPVWVWFAEAIQFDDVSNRRNPMIFLDLIHAVTRMRYQQREKDPDRGIIASLDDFATARDIYAALNGDEGSQGTQLTPDEARLLEAMIGVGGRDILIEDMVRQTHFPDHKIRRLLSGRRDRNTTGLLSKCPALTEERGHSSVTAADGVTRGRQLLKFTLDEREYNAWKNRGGVTLIPERIEEALTRLTHDLPTVYPHVGKKVTGTYGASFPNLTNIIINNNNNNNNLPKKGKREGDPPTPIDTHTHMPPYSLTSGKWVNVDPTPPSEQTEGPNSATPPNSGFPSNGSLWVNSGEQITTGGKP